MISVDSGRFRVKMESWIQKRRSVRGVSSILLLRIRGTDFVLWNAGRNIAVRLNLTGRKDSMMECDY